MFISEPSNDDQLDELLTQPTQKTVEAVSKLEGDLLILGAGGKMGPTIALLAQRSIQAAGLPYKVKCVSRFSSNETRQFLVRANITTVSGDLMRREVVDNLPDAPNVIFLVGMKFGSKESKPLTWMLNTYVPGLVAHRYAFARIVALSTGNIYPFTPVVLGGADEEVIPNPIGDYAQSCLGRERIFQHAALEQKTPITILRLNYANDLRYGVLRDIAQNVFDGQPVNLVTGNVNVIWQGDANRVIIQSLSICSSPARILNVTGPETVSVRWLAEQFGHHFGRSPVFSGDEASTALLSNAAECHRLFGYPDVTLMQMIHWTAHWVKNGGRALSKPTHFEVRDGQF
jgi:nucleoside-diphosphate-sugar epimerase